MTPAEPLWHARCLTHGCHMAMTPRQAVTQNDAKRWIGEHVWIHPTHRVVVERESVTAPEIGRSKSGNLCSWCLREFHVPAIPGQSHGICQRHFDEMKADIVARRATRGTTP